MLEVSTVSALREWVRAARSEGRRIGFVPTMGFLHEGHLTLVDAARRAADAVVMSVFVNPLQFAANEDFSRYPRDIPRDRALAAGRGVDLLFTPSVDEMYPGGAEATAVRVVPGGAADQWEGAVRPGHFAGVLTVVAKLFHMVEPDIACFGQKDIQQLTLVRGMVRDLNWPLAIALVPTVREPDGLALSSRNVYLSAADRQQALGLSRSLAAAAAAWAGGEHGADRLATVMRTILADFPGVAVDYLAIVEPNQLAPVAVAVPGTILAIAARVGTTRLIDNVIVGEALA
ncbi:MAG: pantoate--beta-alanine ligase [Gemmatimonadales bacterium]|nr:pantoate--beta-alanine ligase [Gemmatimonadales bacterium]